MKKNENEALNSRFRAEGGNTNDSTTNLAAPAAPTDAKPDELIEAANAVVERWHSKDWKQPHTAEFIARLAAAVGVAKFDNPTAAPSVRDAAQPTIAAEDARDAIPRESNDALLALARRWKLDGDWMTCKGCKRSLIASRDGEELNHADGCKHADQQHPWAQLRELIARRPIATPKPQSKG